MPAIDRTTRTFVASVKHAIPTARVEVISSNLTQGRSRYVYIHHGTLLRPIKVRISDHPIGMRRAIRGGESLLLNHTATIDSWAVWLGTVAANINASIRPPPAAQEPAGEPGTSRACEIPETEHVASDALQPD